MSEEKLFVLIAEGITDCSLLEAILEKYMNYRPYNNKNDLPELFWEMVGNYPMTDGALTRGDSPTFYYKDNISVAVKQAGGCTKIAKQAALIIEIIDQMTAYEKFGGFLLFCDTDTETKEDIVQKIKKEFHSQGLNYFDNKEIVEAYGQDVCCCLHCFPTQERGAIEKLLLECTKISYGQINDMSYEYRYKVEHSETLKDMRKECWAKSDDVQEFYADKVQFGAISSVLKPDKPVRFTIKDKLIRKKYKEKYMEIPEFEVLYTFLENRLSAIGNTT